MTGRDCTTDIAFLKRMARMLLACIWVPLYQKNMLAHAVLPDE
jgi:hypothetical protein